MEKTIHADEETAEKWADRISQGSSVLQRNWGVGEDEQVAGGVIGMEVKICNLSVYRGPFSHGARWNPLVLDIFQNSYS